MKNHFNKPLLSVSLVSLLMLAGSLVSCGDRKARMAPTKTDKKSNKTGSGDLQATGNEAKPCTVADPSNCGNVGIRLDLLGAVTKKVQGFIADSDTSVNWMVRVKSDSPDRVFAVYLAKDMFALNALGFVHGEVSEKQVGNTIGAEAYPADAFVIQPQQTQYNPYNQYSNSQYSSQQQTINNVQAKDRSQGRVEWSNAQSSQGELHFVVRDVTQCIARSKAETAHLCNVLTEDKSNFERTLKVPYKVAKSMLTEAKDEGSVWGKLAACLVLGFAQTSGFGNDTTGQILDGVVTAVSGGGSSGCGSSTSLNGSTTTNAKETNATETKPTDYNQKDDGFIYLKK